MCRKWGVALMLVSAMGWSAAAPAYGMVNDRIGFFAERLRQDPVYVTDNAPQSLEVDAAPRIRAAVSRLGVPVYVVVALFNLPQDTTGDPESVIPILHDRLGRNGVYIVTDPRGLGAVRQYGGGLRVTEAWRAADAEMGYNAPLPDLIDRFVELTLSGTTSHRPAPEPTPVREPDRWAAADRAESRARDIGTVIGGVATLILLGALWWRSAQRRRLAAARPAARRRTRRGNR